MSDDQDRKDNPETVRVFEMTEEEAGEEKVVARVPAPRKGTLTVLTHDEEDAGALIGLIIRTSNGLSALLAALEVTHAASAPAADPADTQGAARVAVRTLMEHGASFLALREMIARLYPEGLPRLMADIEALRATVMPAAGRSASAEADSAADGVFRGTKLEEMMNGTGLQRPGQTGGAEKETGETPALFIPRAPRENN